MSCTQKDDPQFSGILFSILQWRNQPIDLHYCHLTNWWPRMHMTQCYISRDCLYFLISFITQVSTKLCLSIFIIAITQQQLSLLSEYSVYILLLNMSLINDLKFFCITFCMPLSNVGVLLCNQEALLSIMYTICMLY